MKTCHVCLYECEDDMELCPVCGAELKSEAVEEATEEITAETVINAPF